jgi:hypothetical protein
MSSRVEPCSADDVPRSLAERGSPRVPRCRLARRRAAQARAPRRDTGGSARRSSGAVSPRLRGVQRYWRAARLAASDSVPRGSANGRQLGHAGAEALAVAQITRLPAELTLRLPVRDTTHPRHQRYANFAADDPGDERGHTARRLCADRLCEAGDPVTDRGGDVRRRCCKRPSRRPRPQ